MEIFYKAITEGKYTSFLGPDSLLPMMYMPDCLKVRPPTAAALAPACTALPPMHTLPCASSTADAYSGGRLPPAPGHGGDALRVARGAHPGHLQHRGHFLHAARDRRQHQEGTFVAAAARGGGGGAESGPANVCDPERPRHGQIIPDFEISYAPDYRQEIADTWPKVLDDSKARQDWLWQHDYDLDTMCADMIDKLRTRGLKRM